MQVFQTVFPLPLSLLQGKAGVQLSWQRTEVTDGMGKESTYFVLLKFLIVWIISWQLKAAQRTGVCLPNI